MKQRSEDQWHNPEGKHYSGKHSSSTAKWYQFKILTFNIDVAVCCEKSFRSKLIGMGPDLCVSMNLPNVDEDASLFWDVVAGCEAIFCRCMGQ
ncbi:hypothetical protein C1H46_002672 [Malus baccata]|uniref:Uncharacterized protein n=1 Tax=Malus baccata TaxID=106549 RepID=A0A540NKT7_MALBA|nr:hypothetical protein C1H46_002672 [Malus baccata]